MNDVMKKLVILCVKGAKVLDLCIQGDELIEQATAGVYNKAVKGVKVGKGAYLCYCPFWHHNKRTKGLAFPTSISVNNAVAHFSPLA